MRGLRWALTLFGPSATDQEFEPIRDALRWFTGELGDARNLDVYLERERQEKEREALERKRERAYDAVITAMNSRRLRTLMLDLVAWGALGKWRDHASARMPLEPYVNRRIDRLWSRISGAGDLAAMDDEE